MDSKLNGSRATDGLSVAVIALFCSLGAPSVHAAPVAISLQIDPASSRVTTTGGYTGGGIGDFVLAGTFEMTIETDVVGIRSVDVGTSPSSTFVFPQFPGARGNGGSGIVTFSGQQENAVGFPPNKYDGSLANGKLIMQGVYIEAFPDGVNYYYNVNATIIPLPPAALLLLSGLFGLAGVRRLGRASGGQRIAPR